MARIKLSNTGYTMIPEGWYTFEVTEAVYDEDFGKMTVVLTTENGLRHEERYTLLNASGEPNEKAMKAFSIFAKNCMNNFGLEEIDEQELVGRKLQGEIKYMEGTKINPKTGKNYVNVTLGQKKPYVEQPEEVAFDSGATMSIDADLNF